MQLHTHHRCFLASTCMDLGSITELGIIVRWKRCVKFGNEYNKEQKIFFFLKCIFYLCKFYQFSSHFLRLFLVSLFLLLESFICLYLSLPLSLFVTFLPPVLSLWAWNTRHKHTENCFQSLMMLGVKNWATFLWNGGGFGYALPTCMSLFLPYLYSGRCEGVTNPFTCLS